MEIRTIRKAVWIVLWYENASSAMSVLTVKAFTTVLICRIHTIARTVHTAMTSKAVAIVSVVADYEKNNTAFSTNNIRAKIMKNS